MTDEDKKAVAVIELDREPQFNVSLRSDIRKLIEKQSLTAKEVKK